jgi:F420-dependent oxidoreductase-like protein
MAELSISIEGFYGLNWPRWQQLAQTIETLGYANLYCSDHFSITPDQDSLEVNIALAYLATHTQRVHFGQMVAPVSFRDPVMLARQAIAIDNLSGGRMILGLGTGWREIEHTQYGYPLGSLKTRVDRFEEALQVIHLLLRHDTPVSFSGEYYQLQDALLRPRPATAGRPPLLIGAKGEKRMLPLVARYADAWNAVVTSPDEFRTKNARLDELLHQENRPPSAVKRTIILAVFCGEDDHALHQRILAMPTQEPKPLQEMRDALHQQMPRAIIGSPAQVTEIMHQYIDAGVEEILLHWFGLDDIEGLTSLAETVLPDVVGYMPEK